MTGSTRSTELCQCPRRALTSPPWPVPHTEAAVLPGPPPPTHRKHEDRGGTNMGVWLYPVSGSRGYDFRDAGGKKRATGYDAIRDTIEAGDFPKRTAWPCMQTGA